MDRDAVAALIDKRHWGGGESIRAIEKDLGIGRTSLNGACRRHGIQVRSRKAATRLAQAKMEWPKGADHWRSKQPGASERLAEIHRQRMLTDNPMHNPVSRRKSARSHAEHFRRHPTRHESRLIGAFREAGVSFSFQYPIGPYIADFAFVDDRILLEVDGRGHASRSERDAARDMDLIAMGWTIVRVQNSVLRNFRRDAGWHIARLLRILDDLIADADLVSPEPSPAEREYRVLIRDQETPAGRCA